MIGKANRRADAPSASAPKILVVDDEIDVLRSTQMLLERIGYATLLLPDAKHVQDVAQKEAPVLIIHDVLMPGLDLTASIQNLRRNPAIAFVIGGPGAGEERTVQYEGVADEPAGPDLDRLKERYFVKFPDGRERQKWPGIAYFRVEPRWVRFSDFTAVPPQIVEFTFE